MFRRSGVGVVGVAGDGVGRGPGAGDGASNCRSGSWGAVGIPILLKSTLATALPAAAGVSNFSSGNFLGAGTSAICSRCGL